MSEEIKFRAWDKEYNHMYQNAYPFEHLVYVEVDKNDREVQAFKHKMMEVNGKWFYFLLAKDVELMQYTNLHDKHGKEIYEGDIVKGQVNVFDAWRNLIRRDEVISAVEYQEGWFLSPFSVVQDNGKFWHENLIDGFEVIGNIYEHPTLLEANEEKQ